MWMSAVRIHAKTTQLASMMSTDTFVNVTRDSGVRKLGFCMGLAAKLVKPRPYKGVGSEK